MHCLRLVRRASAPLDAHLLPGAVQLLPKRTHATPGQPVVLRQVLPLPLRMLVRVARLPVPGQPAEMSESGEMAGGSRQGSTRRCILSLQLRCFGDTAVGSTSGQASTMSGAASPHRTAMLAVNTRRRRSLPYTSSEAPKYLAATRWRVRGGLVKGAPQAGDVHAQQVRIQVERCQLPALRVSCIRVVAAVCRSDAQGRWRAGQLEQRGLHHPCHVRCQANCQQKCKEAPTARTCSAMSVRSIKSCSAWFMSCA